MPLVSQALGAVVFRAPHADRVIILAPQVGGDGLVASIAAASIIAKVSRDRLMRRLCVHYPVYRFSTHFGYATKIHLAAIFRLLDVRNRTEAVLKASSLDL